ncbi:Retrotransposon protein, Ty3-gypsy subclass [Gossypium australe]|uniref:Retrotransposon protein, Ty3-gypsy subclass n=1 Tax=Gossypium australe TaxID=47621 RepID=A0A5B6WPS7_9ROSI|nr:Retrotransposon protein, Ty3-gypsy subclass [Gossypium australe]
MILCEAHDDPFAMHLDSAKMPSIKFPLGCFSLTRFQNGNGTIIIFEQKKCDLNDNGLNEKAVRIDWSLLKLAEVYIHDIVRLHSVSVSFIFNRDPRLTLRFWKHLHELLCTRLNFNMTFHPQYDACIVDLDTNWECYLLLAEFVYNKNFQSSIQMTLYEALYGCRCRTLFIGHN